MKRLSLIILSIFLGLSLVACNFTTANFSDIKTASSINSTTYKPIDITTTFTTDTPKIYVTGTINNAPEGTIIKAEWIYIDTDPDTLIDDVSITINEITQDFYFELSKPLSGWPPGQYRIKLYIDDTLETTVSFTVE